MVSRMEGRGRLLGRWCWLALLPLAACGPGHSPEDAPFAWWHGLEGGVIAQQRPPPPGVDDPYPHVGTTPARPTVPSKTVRDSLTASLAAQRTETHRLDVDQPIPPPAAAPAPAKAGAAAPPASATIEAAGDAPAAAPGAPAPPPPKPAPLATPEQQEAKEPVLAMPPAPAAVTVVGSGPLPEMPASPPSPPSFSDFAIPTTQVARLTPDYVPEAVHLSNLGFVPGSDELLPASRSLLDHMARGSGTRAVAVTGFGEARSDAPADQETALHLALARAATAAAELRRSGVVSARIKIAASPFGRGGDVTVVQ